MIRETCRGVTIRTAKGRHGSVKLTVGGVSIGEQDGTETHVLRVAKGTVDLVQDGCGVNEREAHWFPRGTVDQAKLVREITARHFETRGPLAPTCKAYVAQRVNEIVESMHRNPANYDAATGRITVAGAAVVTQIIGNDAATGYAWREIGQMIEDAEREAAE